ncbi:phage portal protein [Sansalvadorimonas verongulae]|uniref:phage portal protein n=1 Tax=Sansalvadorimonas verongulae TaxID=2172824 RepID=UPI0012BC77ED|nr:phage portal protein [Sansalvadorimonas verongulae]MTI12640.1 phage portal protein [Sansalvadorimonas verongulae]
MGIFSSMKDGNTLDNPSDWLTNALGGARPTATGIRVTPDTALTSSAVLSCILVISEDIAKLPLILYQRDGDGKKRAVEHPVYKLVHRKPNRFQSPFEFKQMMMFHVLRKGDAFGVIVRDGAGNPVEVIPQDSDHVNVLKAEDGELFYNLGKGRGIAPPEDIIHLRGLSRDGKTGLSLVKLMAESIGLSIATEKHGAAYFGNGAMPGYVLEHSGKLSKEAKDNIREDWNKIHQGVANSNRIAVLSEGMKANQVSLSNEDSQFLETRSFQRYEIAGFFRVAPHLIGLMDKATFTNIEHQGQSHAGNALMPWCVRFEEKLNSSLLFEDEQDEYFFEFLMDAVVRADFKTRMDGYKTAIDSRVMNPNECRSRENLSPYDGGNEFLRPLNMERPEGGEQE